jgi:uncharacterized membrane protein
MSELIAIAFDNRDDADHALNELNRLKQEYLVDLEDAVVAVRAPDGKVRLKQSVNLVGASAAGGAFWGGLWGMLVGLLFLNPLLGWATGLVFGGGASALAATLADYGINDDFMRKLGQSLKPDTSALFVLVRKMQPEKVLKELSSFRGTVIRSSLSPEQEEKLQQALQGVVPPAPQPAAA